MKFGCFSALKAKGGILAHSLSLPDGKRLRKGVVINDQIIEKLMKAGVEEVTVAMPEDGEILEDVAATLIAEKFDDWHLRIEEASTGRVNIFAKGNGVFRVSKKIINQINSIDPAITIATLPDYKAVNSSRLVATIKIIPYAVKAESLETVLGFDIEKAIAFHPYSRRSIGLITTTLPTLKKSVMEKTRRNFEQRLKPSCSVITENYDLPHDADTIATLISTMTYNNDIIVIFGASAISDIADCIPEGIKLAGGEIIRFGMPVDPGNLLLLAKIGDIPIIGAPGCARSIAENGFDWVLNRMLAGIDVTAEDIAGMGVGGLLMETGNRPHPRETKPKTSFFISGLILAAGQSRRMGKENKMTVEVNGKPMVRHIAEAALNSKLSKICVVTGHKPQSVVDALDGIEFQQFDNSNYANGLSTSLIEGINRIGNYTSHALILLGDMPFISSQMLNQMIEASAENPENIIVATHDGKRGNPVLWPRRFFEELKTIEGDVGARRIMVANREMVTEVELGEAASLDLDTPEAVRQIEDRAQQ